MTDDISGDTSGDMSGDMSGDGRWMTYDEPAKLRGIARSSAERLVQRNQWRRQRGNDRTVRVLVPVNGLSGDMSDDSADVSPDTGMLADALATMKDAVAALTARAEIADKRADQADAHADAERRRADDERIRADDERHKAAAAERRAVKAEHDRDQLLASHNRALLEVETVRTADRARRSAGRLVRIKAAWRGE